MPGTFVGLVGSNEVMMLETLNIEDGKLKVSGPGLVPFLNNRFIRASAAHQDRYWNLAGMPAGQTMAHIVNAMCIYGPPTNQFPLGVFNTTIFAIPGLNLGAFDMSGPVISVAVPYGPIYDALKTIGTTYQVGMQIYLESADDNGFVLRFRTYRGLDRTAGQNVNSPVQFSPTMDSLTDIKELQSIAGYKTIVYSYAPSNPGELATTPGYDARVALDTQYKGFDLRAEMVFAEDITTDTIGGDPDVLLAILNSRARDALADANFAKVVDGEIVPTAQFKYGRDYSLGDVIELQGNTGTVQNARVTEFIRVHDTNGERHYPTVTITE
jgi:hypothetical protein